MAKGNRRSRRGGLASADEAAYACNAVKRPFINVEENNDRFVGRRSGAPDALSTATSEPTVEDLRNFCRELNQRGAKQVVE